MRSLIRFTKMQGSGNDFVVIEGITQQVQITPALVRQLSDRRLGIGFDQLLLLEAPTKTPVDFSYRIFNSDGSEVSQCGNGARCVARFAIEAGLTSSKNMSMETRQGRLEMQVQKGGMVRVNMGRPSFVPKDIPTTSHPSEGCLHHLKTTPEVDAFIVSFGNPHCIIQSEQTDVDTLHQWSQQIEALNLFPEGINLTLMQVLARNHIRLTILERGAGLTQACGSAACAAVVTGIERGLLANEVQVDMPGGHVSVLWSKPTAPVFLTGPTASVYRGHFVLHHN